MCPPPCSEGLWARWERPTAGGRWASPMRWAYRCPRVPRSLTPSPPAPRLVPPPAPPAQFAEPNSAIGFAFCLFYAFPSQSIDTGGFIAGLCKGFLIHQHVEAKCHCWRVCAVVVCVASGGLRRENPQQPVPGGERSPGFWGGAGGVRRSMAPVCLFPGCVSHLPYEENQIPLTLHQMSLVSEQLRASKPPPKGWARGLPSWGAWARWRWASREAVVLMVET